MTEQFANKIETTVGSAYTAGSGTLVVASATGFPAIGTFRVRLGNVAGSILRVDSRSGTTLTVVAEADDGNAGAGDTVTIVLSAGAMEQIKTDAVGSLRFSSATDVGTDADTAEKTLKSYTLPGGTLASDGDALRIVAAFRCAANANTKRMRIKFGATTIADSTAVAANARNFLVIAVVWRRSATAQLAKVFAAQGVPGQNWTSALGGNHETATPAETLASDVVIAVTGQNGTASANDLICDSLLVELVKAP